MWHPVHMKRSQSLKFPLLGATINTQITEAQKGAGCRLARGGWESWAGLLGCCGGHQDLEALQLWRVGHLPLMALLCVRCLETIPFFFFFF